MLKQACLAGWDCPVKLPIPFACDLHREIFCFIWSIGLSLLHLNFNEVHFFFATNKRYDSF